MPQIILTYNSTTAKWQAAAQTVMDGVEVYELLGKPCHNKVECWLEAHDLRKQLTLQELKQNSNPS